MTSVIECVTLPWDGSFGRGHQLTHFGTGDDQSPSNIKCVLSLFTQLKVLLLYWYGQVIFQDNIIGNKNINFDYVLTFPGYFIVFKTNWFFLLMYLLRLYLWWYAKQELQIETNKNFS